MSGLPLQPLRWVGDAATGRLHLVDQTRLPRELVEVVCADAATLHEAIRSLRVRGAPAIGMAAAHGLVLVLQPARQRDLPSFRTELEAAAAELIGTRPTAVNLHWAVRTVVEAACGASSAACHDAMHAAAARIEADQSARSEAMATAGIALLAPGERILTICNAGPLAAGGLGSALGVVLLAAQRGLAPCVWACETRPLLQGARLTAFEMTRAGIPVTVLADSAAAQLMARGMVSRVLVGADRIARNGDTANKIGTYALALAAKAHGIPFHVVAPLSTCDPSIRDRSGIPVEERAPEEVLSFQGIPVAAAEAKAINPAFDITPAALITSFITERGVVAPAGLAALLPPR